VQTTNHIGQNDKITKVHVLAPDAMTSLFRAAAKATEEANLNAMCMAETINRSRRLDCLRAAVASAARGDAAAAASERCVSYGYPADPGAIKLESARVKDQ
jgi:L-aminopeptidase/D-esterase-like protein